MYSVTKEIRFCYAHRLMDHEGPCRHLHGHNGRLQVVLASQSLDDQGMVYEFGDLKAVIQTWVDEQLDHQTLLREDDPLVPCLKELEQPVHVMAINPTAESIAAAVFHYAVEQGLPVVEVRLWETDTACASYKE